MRKDRKQIVLKNRPHAHLKVFFILVLLLPSGHVQATSWYSCSPERLLAEHNPIEKIYCYAEKFDFRANAPGGYPGGIDWEDAYLNDPMFDQLVPLANRIIMMESRGIATQEDVLQKALLERQIEIIFNNRKSSSEQAKQRQEEREREEQSRTMRNIALGALVLIFVVPALISGIASYTDPKNIEQRKLDRERRSREQEEERLRKEEAERIVRQQKTAELQARKDAEMALYRKVRKEIEAMPKYQVWREEVLKKYGHKCAVGGETENIEVDHYPVSMYQLVKNSGILNLSTPEAIQMKAYEYTPFWDVNNGAPLCKKHHDQTTSSRFHMQNNG